jgi:hypothetical protein
VSIPHATAHQLLATLTENGILHEQCACGCDLALHFPWRPEGEPAPPIHDATFCHACWSDRCNGYRPVYVLDQRAADAYDRKHEVGDFAPIDDSEPESGSLATFLEDHEL